MSGSPSARARSTSREPSRLSTLSTPCRWLSLASTSCSFQLDLFISNTALEVTDQLETWKGIYDCAKDTEDKLACKKQGLNVFIYVLRDSMKKLSFESWCSPDGWGCKLETGEGRLKVDFFQGTLDGYEGDLCQLDKVPDTLQLNKGFGGSVNRELKPAQSTDIRVKILTEDNSATCCLVREISAKESLGEWVSGGIPRTAKICEQEGIPSLNITAQQEEWLGYYTVKRKTSGQLVYEKVSVQETGLERKKRYLYITRKVDDSNKVYIFYQSWCPKGDHFGCMDDDRELKPVELFIGKIEDQPDKSLCDIDAVPTQYSFNPCFGDPGSGPDSVCPQDQSCTLEKKKLAPEEHALAQFGANGEVKV